MDSSEGDLSVVSTRLLPETTGGFTMSKNKSECTINEGQPSQMSCTGYRVNLAKTILSYIFVLCTGGFGALIFYWKPHWWLKFTHFIADFSQADYVLLKTPGENKEIFIARIKQMASKQASVMDEAYGKISRGESTKMNKQHRKDTTLYFIHQELCYLWSFDQETFEELGSLDERANLEQIYNNAGNPLNDEQVKIRSALFGANQIRVEVPYWWELLIKEVLNPFYVFQLFSCILWFLDDYMIYATVIVISSAVSACVSLWEVRSSLTELHNMVEYHNNTKTTVLRVDNDGNEIIEEIWSKDLVPGDVIVLGSGETELACDACLVSGICIMNESMLTGESVPITKTPLPNSTSLQQEIYSTQLHKNHTLFCGTKVMQARYYAGERVKAVVVRTGYRTAKGQLVHSILYQKPLNMNLLRDAYRFVGVLAFIAFGGFIYSAVVMVQHGESTTEVAVRALDMFTIAVPPALPVAMTIGVVYALNRIKKHSISCISSMRINLCGQIDVVAFDKTGTLTEDGLDIYELMPTNHNNETPNRTSDQTTTFDKAISPQDIGFKLEPCDVLLRGLASCHSLTKIDGKLQGDPLDLILFNATGWNMIEPEDGEESQFDKIQCNYVTPALDLTQRSQLNSSPHELGMVRCFTFESTKQRSSVIVHPSGVGPREMIVYTKGSPEKMRELCLPHTIPHDYASVLKLYAQQGFRMIALGYKPLKITWLKAQKIERENVEKDLIFLGLIALQNKLKPESKGALKKLRDADIRTLMVTGDNILTALSVAHDSGMVDPSDDVILAQTKLPQDDKEVSLPTLTFTYADNYNVKKSTSTNISSENHGNLSADEKSINPSSFIKTNKDVETGVKNWHLAVTGYDFSNIKKYFPEWMETLALKGKVFARMSPDQKTELVEELDKIGHCVSMCGDGANDCGALKRAHVGISLSEYEASVAAPFTSSLENGINCVPLLIREGRAALVTSFGMFKFMALYSLIQFITITLLYTNDTLLSDVGFMYIDLLIIDVIAFTFARNHAYKKLHRQKPANSLTSPEVLASLLYNFFLQTLLQTLGFMYVQNQCWYNELTNAQLTKSEFYNHSTCDYNLTYYDQTQIEDENDTMQYTTTYLLLLSGFMYLTTSVSFSTSYPFRTRIYKNKAFFISLLALYALNTYLILWPALSLLDFMQVRPFPEDNIKYSILLLGFIHFVLSLLFEILVVERPAIWQFVRRHFLASNQPRHKQLTSAALQGRSARDDLHQILDPTTSINNTFHSNVGVMHDVSSSLPSVEGSPSLLITNFSSDK